MLAVYLSLLGTWFLPLAKPLCAGLTALSLLAGWWWVNRKLSGSAASDCGDPRCDCHTVHFGARRNG
jgi:hypothetical protein